MKALTADSRRWTRFKSQRTALFASLLLVNTVANGQWQRVNVATTSSLRGLSAVNKDIVWASGTGGTVIRTIDGGKNWGVMVVSGAEKLDFRGIRAFDENNAVIISSGPAEKGQARIYRTRDAGKTWAQVFEEQRAGIFFDAVAFWDRKHGIVLSDPVDGRFVLFTTKDGGETWAQIPAAAIPPALTNEGAFAASNSCLTVQGQKNVWFATGGANVARVFRSVDQGRTWSVVETPMRPGNASSGIFSLAFSQRYAIAVGGDYAHPEGSDLPNVMYSADGGQSWQVAPSKTNPAGTYLSSAVKLPGVGIDPGGFVAVGPKGAFQLHPLVTPRSTDQTAKIYGIGISGPNPELKMELNAVAIAADFEKSQVQNLWSVGPKGTVAHKTFTSRGR